MPIDASSLRVAVLGAGGIGLGAAVLLAQAGHVPVLWSRSGTPARLIASGQIETASDVAVAASCAEAVAGADVAMLALPGFAHRAVIDAIVPHLRDGQAVIISGHLSFAALYLSQCLARRGVVLPIIAWGTTVTTGRRTAPGTVRIGSIRSKVDLAAVPFRHTEAGSALCVRLFGDRFVMRDGLLAIALSNVNPQNHMGIALCNLTRMERGENWHQNANITAAVGRLLEALDGERLAIAAAFGLSVRTLRQHFHLSFHTPEAPLGEMAAALAARGDDVVAPATLDSRYITEDVPFGLVPTALLGRMVGRVATLHEAGVAIFSAALGRDFTAANDLLPPLGLLGMRQAQLESLARTGAAH